MPNRGHYYAACAIFIYKMDLTVSCARFRGSDLYEVLGFTTIFISTDFYRVIKSLSVQETLAIAKNRH